MLRAQLTELDREAQALASVGTIEAQIRNIADTARSRMLEPTLEVMAAVFDLLELYIVRTGPNAFAGGGSIPLPEGEASEEGLQGLYSNLTGLRLTFRLAIALDNGGRR